MKTASKSVVQWLLLRLYFLLERLRKDSSNKISGVASESYVRLVKPHLQRGGDKLQAYGDTRSILIFAPTIGELRASGYLIELLKKRFPNYFVILMPGKEQYLEQYAALYPDDTILSPNCNEYVSVRALFESFGIRHMLLVEGPSLMGRFPTWLSLAYPVVCIEKQARLSIVNACIYKPEHQNLMARTRTKIFAPLHKYAIECWYTADESFVKDLSLAGVPADAIKVVGDIKFDSVIRGKLEAPTEELKTILEHLSQRGGPVVIAGSITVEEELEFVVSGWLRLKSQYPGTTLVIAPRYIREDLLMNMVVNVLKKQAIKYALRTQGASEIAKSEAIVLDTYGELPHLYSAADLVFAGRDHGVLEPLRFDKPVITGPKAYWNSEYSTSYSLFDYMSSSNALICCESYADIGDHMIRLTEDELYRQKILDNASAAVNTQLGASEEIIKQMALT